MTSSHKDIQFTVTEEERNQKIFTLKKLETDWFNSWQHIDRFVQLYRVGSVLFVGFWSKTNPGSSQEFVFHRNPSPSSGCDMELIPFSLFTSTHPLLSPSISLITSPSLPSLSLPPLSQPWSVLSMPVLHRADCFRLCVLLLLSSPSLEIISSQLALLPVWFV